MQLKTTSLNRLWAICFALVVAILPSLAQDEIEVRYPDNETGSTLKYTLNTGDHTATVTGYTSIASDGAVEVPATILNGGQSYAVTSIGSNAFFNCFPLRSITLPLGLTTIGNHAFSLTSLSSITLPDGLTDIDNFAFSSCTSLSSITLPESLTSIGENAFWDCTSLSSITLPAGLTTIGGSAFSGCSLLSSITLPAGLTTIGQEAFVDCSALSSITLPETVTSLGDYAFYNCSSLTSITLPSSLTTIGNSAFADCSSLSSITLPANLTTIGVGAFYSCSALKTVVIENPSLTVPDGYSIGAFRDIPQDAVVLVPHGAGDAYRAKYPNVPNIVDPQKQLTVDLEPNGTQTPYLSFSSSKATKLYVLGTDPDGKTQLQIYDLEANNGYSGYSLTGALPNNQGEIRVYCDDLDSFSLGSMKVKDFEADPGCTLSIFDIQNSDMEGGKIALQGMQNLNYFTLFNVTNVGDIDFSGCQQLNTVQFNGNISGLTACAIDRMYLTLPKSDADSKIRMFANSLPELFGTTTTAIPTSLGWSVKDRGNPITGDGSGCNSLYLSYDSEQLQLNGSTTVPYVIPDPNNKEIDVDYQSRAGYRESLTLNGQPLTVTDRTIRPTQSGILELSYTELEPQTLSQILAGTEYNSQVVVASGNLAGVYLLENQEYPEDATLLVRETTPIATPQAPTEGQVDFMDLYYHKPHTGYVQANWTMMSNNDTGQHYYSPDQMRSWVGHVINGNLNAEFKNPGLQFSGGDNLTAGEVYETPLNQYTLAALAGSSITAGSKDYFFVQPAHYEVAEIIEAQWDATSRNFVLPASITSVLGDIEPTWHCDFYSNVDTEVEEKLQDGYLYHFKAGIINLSAYDAPRRPDQVVRRAPRTGYGIAPLDLDAASGIPSAVTDLTSNRTVTSVEYISTDGQVSAQPFSGVNIMRERHADGSVTTRKAVIK